MYLRPLKSPGTEQYLKMISIYSFLIFLCRKSRIALTMKDYMGVLWACENIDISNNNHANIIKCKHAYVVYNIFKKEKNIPTDVFVKMMKVCAKLGQYSIESLASLTDLKIALMRNGLNIILCNRT